MKKIITFSDFILEKTINLENNSPALSTLDTKIGDDVVLYGKKLKITKITKTIKNNILSFDCVMKGNKFSVKYDDGKDGYIINKNINESYFVGTGGDIEGLEKVLKHKIGHDYKIKDNKLYFIASEDEETEKELKKITKKYNTKISLE